MRYFAKILMLVLCLTLFGFSVATANDQDKLVLKLGYGVVEGYIERNDSGVGFDLMMAVVKSLEKRGYQVEIIKAPFKRVMAQFTHSNIDMVFPIVSYRGPSRANIKKWGFKEVPLYSSALYNGGQFVIYTRLKEDRIHDVKSLKGLQIGVLAGFFIPGELKAPTKFNVIEIQTPEQAFKILEYGRIDALLVHENLADSVLGKSHSKVLHRGRMFGGILGGFITQQTDSGAVQMANINQAIGDMILDGTYAKILARYPDNKFVLRQP